MRGQAGETNPLVKVLGSPRARRLDSGSSRLPDPLIEFQPSSDVVRKAGIFTREDYSKSGCILDCLASTLRLVWHHGMGRVSEDTGLILVPVLQ